MAPARLWMLSDAQYVRVVAEVFGVALTGADADITTTANTTGVYENLSEAKRVGTPVAQSLQRAAQKVAALARPCGASVTHACVEQFVREQIPRAWRRPLGEAEVARMLQLYTTLEPTEGSEGALQALLEAVLQSGSFIYRTEVGSGVAPGAGSVPLTAHELASALSFTLTDSAPDAALWAAASAGTLTQANGLASEVSRLLELPATREHLTRVAGYWAGVELIPLRHKEPALFSEYTAEVQRALYEGTRLFLSDQLWTAGATGWFSSRRVYVNQALSALYGIGSVEGAALVPVDLPASLPAAGLLTQPGLLSATNKRMSKDDPIHRGLYVFKSLICGGTIPDPPPGATAQGEMMTGTERELAAQRAAQPGCAACHSAFDPLGLVLDAYDPIGRFRSTDASGAPIDTSAVLVGLGPELDGPVTGVSELAQKLESTGHTTRCAAATISSFLLGYTARTPSCSITEAQSTYERTGAFPEFIRALVTAPAFAQRTEELN